MGKENIRKITSSLHI